MRNKSEILDELDTKVKPNLLLHLSDLDTSFKLYLLYSIIDGIILTFEFFWYLPKRSPLQEFFIIACPLYFSLLKLWFFMFTVQKIQLFANNQISRSKLMIRTATRKASLIFAFLVFYL